MNAMCVYKLRGSSGTQACDSGLIASVQHNYCVIPIVLNSVMAHLQPIKQDMLCTFQWN